MGGVEPSRLCCEFFEGCRVAEQGDQTAGEGGFIGFSD